MTEDPSDLELLADLGVELKKEKKKKRTPREERIIAGFEEIQKFVDDNGRLPAHGEDNDIFERLYATRLDAIRRQEECTVILAELDHQRLLEGAGDALADQSAAIDDEALLAELGVEAKEDDVTVLKHVRTAADKKAAEEIANRARCEDFDKFKPLFQAVQSDLDSGARETRPFELKAEIRPGAFFIVGGQKAYVAEIGEIYSNAQGRTDARLRVIFDNGTESNMLMRSLQRALHKDDAGRRITDPNAGPLFSNVLEDDDLPSGTIYVLRSHSDHPMVKDNRDIVHKIGVTGGDVNKRIANAKLEATYLLADVEVVATYQLANIKRSKMENLLHKIFANARLDIEIKDRFGNPVKPQEWFLVPLFIIDQVVQRIQDGTIESCVYDIEQARLVEQ